MKRNMIFDNCIEIKVELQFLTELLWSSYKELMTDDLVRWGDEGRGKQRYAPGSRKQALIRGNPNGETRHP